MATGLPTGIKPNRVDTDPYTHSACITDTPGIKGFSACSSLTNFLTSSESKACIVLVLDWYILQLVPVALGRFSWNLRFGS